MPVNPLKPDDLSIKYREQISTADFIESKVDPRNWLNGIAKTNTYLVSNAEGTLTGRVDKVTPKRAEAALTDEIANDSLKGSPFLGIHRPSKQR